MSDKLTDLQLRFCAEYIKDQNGTQALIRAGSRSTNPNTLAVQANKLLKLPKIQAELGKIGQTLAAKQGITQEGYLSDLVTLRDEAREANQFSAAVKAQELVGRATSMFNPGNSENASPLGALLQQINVNISPAPERKQERLPERYEARTTAYTVEYGRPIGVETGEAEHE